ncbi:MAG TPA: aldehyde-activating protein [Gammaproteobacteria bacterium]|nr:aldehyde-activating protein [Gammaproteobacteria bacterium]
MVKLEGGCHCGNIRVEVGLSRPAETYNPRACDCDFCMKHGAAYLSDPEGSLSIHVQDSRQSNRYRQGSGQAEFLLCSNCGVLVAVSYRDAGLTVGAVNSQVIEGARFGDKTPVSPQKLGPEDKTQRWKDLWFRNVGFTDPGHI